MHKHRLSCFALVLATLPLKAAQPTPFQRDLSPTHAKRLAERINPGALPRAEARRDAAGDADRSGAHAHDGGAAQRRLTGFRPGAAAK